MDLHMEKLEEYIKDEDKIISVPAFAKDLGISIQESQNAINKYVEINKKKIHCAYILNGKTKKNQENVIFMVKEEDLEKYEKIFDENPIKTIYSVQKSNNIDLNIVTLIEKFTEGKIREEALPGSIVSKNCVKRVLKKKILPTLPPATLKGKSSFFMKNPTKSEEKIKEDATLAQNKPENKTKVQNGIANMFSKASAAKKIEEKPLEDKKPTKNGAMSNFLAKSSSKVEIKKENASIKSEETINLEENDECMEVDVEEEKGIVASHKIVKNEENNSKKRTKKRNRSQSTDKSTKRRKRIVERNDSDSDDIFGDDNEEEDIIDRTDEEPDKPPTPIKKPLAPKNKRRKAVEKTYQDDEGFIVTKTEYVYETASEDEIEEPVKKVEVPKQKTIEKKNSSSSETENTPQTKSKKGKKAPATNQPTLMNFFKRK